MKSLKLIPVIILFVLIGCTKQSEQNKDKTGRDSAAGDQKNYKELSSENVKKITDFIEKYSDSMLTIEKEPGMIISITQGDKVIYEKAKGLANVNPPQPMDMKMRYRIGSLTKTFTATVILQLIDEKKLGLDESIEKFFPNVPNAKNITVRMLGNMTSGMHNYSETKEFMQYMGSEPKKKWKPEELVALSLKNKPDFEPGKGWHYSNTNTVMLGMIIEKITGNTLGAEIKKRISDKLGLKETEFDETPQISGNHSHGYGENEDTLIFPLHDVTAKYDPSWGWAAGAITSTIADMKIYLKALGEGSLTSKEMHTERLKWALDEPPKGKYGFGIFEINNGYYGHNGSYPGFRNIGVHSPVKNITALIFFNTQSNRDPNVFLRAVLPIIE